MLRLLFPSGTVCAVVELTRTSEVADDAAAVEVPISVRVAGVEGVAMSPRGALVAARELMSDALDARVHGYLSACFYIDNLLVGAVDGSQLRTLLRREGLDVF